MGYFIDESLNDTEFTAAGNVPATFGGTPRRIESITIHHWGSYGQTHDGVLNWFVNNNDATSAHFVVSDGRINCLVSPIDSSWSTGNAYGNATTIAIECRPEATDGDYATVAWLVAWLRDVYGDLPLYPHSHWTATSCPGKWDLDRLDALARGTSPAPTETQEEDMTIYDPLTRYDQWGKADGNKTSVALEAQWAAANNARLSGQIAGVLEAVRQLAKAQGASIDVDAIARAAEDGTRKALTEGTVRVDVNVAGGTNG